GPVPTGARLAAWQVVSFTAFSPMQLANCFFWMIIPLDPVKATYWLGLVSFQVILTVFGSTASTLAIGSKFDFVVQAVFSSAQYCQVKTTSSAVKSLPSDHLIPFFSFHVTLLRSLATPPLSAVGISSARNDTSCPFSFQRPSGSRITVAASKS